MKLTVTSSPHIRRDIKTSRIMMDVALALLPALTVGIFVLGIRAAAVTLICVATAVGSEWLFCKAIKGINTVTDGSAAVTGLLLSMTLPHTVPFWQAALGSVFAIMIVKALFGGLGKNIFNPALAASAFLRLVFPVGMTQYSGLDGLASATPLGYLATSTLPPQSLWTLLLGNYPGSIGEVSALCLLLGGIYLVCREVISLRIPAAYLGTVAILTLFFHKTGVSMERMLYSLLSGGLILGAVFMATDYTTSPTTSVGQLIYGVGCGVLTVLFRYYGLFSEGVTFAILIMNAFVRIIDRHTAPRRFGTKRGGAAQ